MIEALDKLVSSTKDEDGKIQFASRDLHLSDRDAAHHVTHVLSDEAQAPAEDDGTEIERCMKLVHAINFIRSRGFGDNLIGFPPDLDRMLDRAIQKHIDDYNHPKI